MKQLFVFLLLLLQPLLIQAQDEWNTKYRLADSLLHKRDFKNSAAVWKDVLILAESTYGTSSSQYISSLNKFASCVGFVWEKERAASFLDSTYNIINESTPDSKEQLLILQSLGIFYSPFCAGNNSILSEKYLTASVALADQHNLSQTSENLLTLKYLSAFYKHIGSFKVAEKYYKECIRINEIILGDSSPYYAASLANLALLYHELNRYDEAEILLLKSLKIRKDTEGEHHPGYAESAFNLGSLYLDMGNYYSSERLYKQSMQIWKDTYGENDSRYLMGIGNLAGVYYYLGDYNKCIEYCEISLSKNEEYYGEMSLECSRDLYNLGLVYSLSGKYDKAYELNKKSEEIRIKASGTDNPGLVEIYNSYAQIHFYKEEFDQAISYYKKAYDLCLKFVGSDHRFFKSAERGLAETKWALGKRDEALTLSRDIALWALAESKIAFSFLSEEQKENYYNTNLVQYLSEFNSYAVQKGDEYSESLYNIQLASKGMLMQSSQKLKTRILNSGDSLLVEKFWKWNALKDDIIKALDMGEMNRKIKGINLDSMKLEAENLEKEISRDSQAFASLTDSREVKWTDIKKILKKGEAAVEIVRILKYGVKSIVVDSSYYPTNPTLMRYKKYGLTDSVQYAALIIKRNSSMPEVVLLENGNDIEDKIFTYYKNMINYKLEDTLSYNAFWKPIKNKLGKIKKVYFSPDGVYNQLSINTLHNPSTGHFVIDEIDLHLVTNTKDILSFNKKNNKHLSAELIGFPIYDLNTKNAGEERIQTLESDSTRAFANFQRISTLPGTKVEVVNISEILSSKAYELDILTELEATEENIKNVYNPKILHISTHGFFIDDNEANDKVNPMLRSGLLLTGVSDFKRAEIKPETEDGILTALEAANLELDYTDLVVLSACETGLGAIKAGEGVYGLQRAFKVAGAKTIVMSMWKVNDEVTQKLMTVFYKHYASSNNARAAFKLAQLEIKKEYPEPYFWGAFVMTGE